MLTLRRRYRFWLLLLMVVTMIVLLRYERCTITTLFRRRDGLINLVVAGSTAAAAATAVSPLPRIRLQILVGHRIIRRYCCCGRHRYLGWIQLDVCNTTATFD